MHPQESVDPGLLASFSTINASPAQPGIQFSLNQSKLIQALPKLRGLNRADRVEKFRAMI